MIFQVLKDGEEVNTVVADENFISKYCEKNGFTFEKVEKPVSAGRKPTDTEVLNTLLGVI